MIREICDVCKINDADKRYKIKRSSKVYIQGCAYKGRFWNNYEKNLICNECAEKLFNISLQIKAPGHRK